MTAPPSSNSKMPLIAGGVLFGLGLAGVLVMGGAVLGIVYYVKTRAKESPTQTPAATAQAPGEGAGQPSGSSDIPSRSPDSAPASGDSLPALPPSAAPGDPKRANPPAVPARSGPSVLGTKGAVDQLDVPVVLPKGMLPFLRGLDLLGANRPLEAVPFFTQAIGADEENSDFYTVRGACHVVAERMQEGLPDLQRALKLNPRNVLASRMTRLAYLMLGEQLAASKFYGHGSTQNVDFLITEVGVGYGSAISARKHGYPQAPQDRQKTEAAIRKLPAVAGLVAATYRSGEEKAVQALFALGVEQVRSGDFEAARRSFRDVLAKYPYDWTSRYYYARSLLETGDPELARRELTYVLCWKRFLPEAFAARALAAARQGDAQRAQADLANLARLDAAQGAAAKEDVERWLAQTAAKTPSGQAAQWDALGELARSNAGFDELIAAALKLRRGVDARRLRWDETYQDRLHALCEAARAQPGHADRLADVAAFLRENKKVYGLTVESNGAPRFFRRQSADTAKWEIELAYALAQEGLAADPNHARSHAVTSAILLLNYSRLEEAERSAQAAIRCDPKLVDGHMALSDCYHEHAVRLREESARLRSPKTGTRKVVDQHGNYLHDETYLIPASAADLARAEACDRAAAEYEQKEQGCLNRALACATGTKHEPFYKALMRFLCKDYAGARPWLEKSVQQDPQDPAKHHQLANGLKALGLEEEYLEAFARAINLQETSAEVWLSQTWHKLERNAWIAARASLERARPLDPADARIWAYRGILAEHGENNAAEAAACYRAALAQEEARARINGTTYAGAPPNAGPLNPEDLGLSMVLRLKLARLYFRNQPAQAAELYLATAEAERRLSDWGLASPVYAARLPYTDRGERETPGPQTLVGLLKNNRVYAGQALVNAGRGAEAAQQFAEAEFYAQRLPAGGTAYLDAELERHYVPFRVSSMPVYVKALHAQALLQQGKREEARLLLQQVRFYLANRTQEQRAMSDDPIPGIYAQLAPQVGLR